MGEIISLDNLAEQLKRLQDRVNQAMALYHEQTKGTYGTPEKLQARLERIQTWRRKVQNCCRYQRDQEKPPRLTKSQQKTVELKLVVVSDIHSSEHKTSCREHNLEYKEQYDGR